MFLSERISPCGNGATWSDLDATTQVLVVNTRYVNYDAAMLCCQEHCGQLIKIDTSYKMKMLTDHLTG